MSIEGIQEPTKQVEGGGRQRTAGHEVEGNEGEEDPGIADEIGHEQKDVFFRHLGRVGMVGLSQ